MTPHHRHVLTAPTPAPRADSTHTSATCWQHPHQRYVLTAPTPALRADSTHTSATCRQHPYQNFVPTAPIPELRADSTHTSTKCQQHSHLRHVPTTPKPAACADNTHNCTVPAFTTTPTWRPTQAKGKQGQSRPRKGKTTSVWSPGRCPPLPSTIFALSTKK